MDIALKERFLRLWQTYFCGAELPIVFYYTDKAPGVDLVKPPSGGHRCIMADLAQVRAGRSMGFAPRW